jgi:hypothetical protein
MLAGRTKGRADFKQNRVCTESKPDSSVFMNPREFGGQLRLGVVRPATEIEVHDIQVIEQLSEKLPSVNDWSPHKRTLGLVDTISAQSTESTELRNTAVKK